MNVRNANQTVFVSLTEEQFEEWKSTLLRLEEAITKKEKAEDDFLTVEKVLALFGCSRATLYNWQKKGYITPKTIGGRVYYKKSECLKAFEVVPQKMKGGRKNG